MIKTLKESLAAEKKQVQDFDNHMKENSALLEEKDVESSYLREQVEALSAEVEELSSDNADKDMKIRTFEETLDLEKSMHEESLNNSSRTLNELELIRLMLQGKEKVNDDLEAQNSLLKQTVDEYQESVSQLQESLYEKEALYEESVQQIEKVKEMLENDVRSSSLSPIKLSAPTMDFQETVDTELPLRSIQLSDEMLTESTMDEQESGWDDGSGWGDENVLPESEQPLESSPAPPSVNVEELNAEIDNLRDNIEQLNEQNTHKDLEISSMRLELEKTVKERDELEKTKQNEADVAVLKDEIQSLNEVKNHKDTIIAKLKLKLKQTMKGRDQLKENLQSEIDRLSEEKDLIFNEISEKLQQHNSEAMDLKNSNELLTESLKAVEKIVSFKDNEAAHLKESF